MYIYIYIYREREILLIVVIIVTSTTMAITINYYYYYLSLLVSARGGISGLAPLPPSPAGVEAESEPAGAIVWCGMV